MSIPSYKCPTCVSKNTQPKFGLREVGERLQALGLLLLLTATIVGLIFVPSVLPREKRQCKDCGHVWKVG